MTTEQSKQRPFSRPWLVVAAVLLAGCGPPPPVPKATHIKQIQQVIASVGASNIAGNVGFINPASASHGSEPVDDFPGYSHESGNLGAFILQNGSKVGAHIRKTNNLPSLTGNWRFKEDADGIQIYIIGDHFSELQTFLTAAFGPPAYPPSTNEMMGTKHIGTFYGANLGAGLVYGWETTRNDKHFTSMVLTKWRTTPQP